MKKVSLLIMLVLVASLLMAAVPTKMVRLTIINKSDYDVYIKLTGSTLTEGYYYLTIPSGTKAKPTVKVFTVMMDIYERETWMCGGTHTSGTLLVDGNIRLTFTTCFQTLSPCAGYGDWYRALGGVWYNHQCGTWTPYTGPDGIPGTADDWTKRHRYAGEPRMEKVTYFKMTFFGKPKWNLAYLYSGWWNVGCNTWYYRVRTYQLPYGCQWRYQY